MNKKSICKWESTCDDDCRRPYGNCPENCQNYKPYVSIEQLEKENAELKKETKRLSAVDETNELLLKHQNSLKKEVHDLRKENEELKEQMGRAGYRIAELKMQIEKMKCCYNCKYGRIYFVKEIIVDCLANKVNSNNKYENCDKWELRK